MSIRLPLQTVLDTTISETTPGAASVAGVIPRPFNLPQDTDNVIVKIQQASISGTGSVSILFQTSDDGGTTWFDVARSGAITSSQFATSVLSGTAHWMSIPVVSSGMRTTQIGSVVATGSVVTVGSIMGVIGQQASSTLATGNVSGLPILGLANRICLIYAGDTTTNNGVRVKVMVNSQTATA